MAKSSSRKKFANADIAKEENAGLTHLTEWTKRELANLQSESKWPICLRLTNGNYIVATYTVEKVDTGWVVGEHNFYDKRCAIFYCALLHMFRYTQADTLLKMDQRVGILDYDKTLFRTKLDKAHLDGNQFRIDLFSSRFDETKSKLVVAKQDLEKTLRFAKYNELVGNLT